MAIKNEAERTTWICLDADADAMTDTASGSHDVEVCFGEFMDLSSRLFSATIYRVLGLIHCLHSLQLLPLALIGFSSSTSFIPGSKGERFAALPIKASPVFYS